MFTTEEHSRVLGKYLKSESLALLRHPPRAWRGVEPAEGRGAAPRPGGAGRRRRPRGILLTRSEFYPRFLRKVTWGGRWVLFWFFVFLLRDLSSLSGPRGPRTPPGAGVLTVEPARGAPQPRPEPTCPHRLAEPLGSVESAASSLVQHHQPGSLTPFLT